MNSMKRVVNDYGYIDFDLNYSCLINLSQLSFKGEIFTKSSEKD